MMLLLSLYILIAFNKIYFSLFEISALFGLRSVSKKIRFAIDKELLASLKKDKSASSYFLKSDLLYPLNIKSLIKFI